MLHLLIVDTTDQSSKAFIQQQYFRVSYQNNMHLLSQANADVIVVFERAVDINTLLEKIKLANLIPYVFYVANVDDSNITSLCEVNNIYPISREMNVSEVIEVVIDKVIPKNNNKDNVYLLMGADHKVGTTSLIHSIANELSFHIDKSILVMSLCNYPNDEFVDNQTSSIDLIRSQINTKVVAFSDILRASISIGKYKFLGGPKDLLESQSYQVEDIINLINVANNQDDYLVLIDGGSDVFSSLSTAAVKTVSNKIAVITDSDVTYHRWSQKIEQIYKPYFNINFNDFLYVLNFFDENINESSKVMKLYDSIALGCLPYSNFSKHAEESLKPISYFDDAYRHDMSKISRVIATKSGHPYASSEKVSFFKKMFGRRRDDALSFR